MLSRRSMVVGLASSLAPACSDGRRLGICAPVFQNSSEYDLKRYMLKDFEDGFGKP